MQAVKERFVKLLGVGAPEDVAVTPSTSYALSLVAASVHLRPGQQIVVLEAQSASNVMQWQVLCPGACTLVLRGRAWEQS
jgi:selenocysteine lyase/cysteine desulfurase